MSSQLLLIIFTTISLGIIFLAALIILGRLRTRGYLERALNMSLFSVVLPREFPSAQQGVAQKSEKELISVMEQLISSFSNIHSKGWNKFLYGEPYVAIEVAVHHVGKEIYFYISVPRKSEEIFEKQIHGFFPTAEIQKIKDYTIFNSEGVAIGGYLKIEGNPLLPFKTYQNLESDPLNGIITSLSKIQEEGEGAAIQILIRPSHRKDLKTLAQKVAREMQGGYDFKKALSRAKNPPKKNTGKDGQKPEDAPMPVTPFGQEIIKAIQNKASKQTFDTNIRVIVSAESEIRATQILEDISGSFVQYNAPDLNQIKLVKLTGGAARKLAFNFSFRRNAFDKIGGYNTYMDYGGDELDLRTRLEKVGKIIYDPRLSPLSSNRRSKVGFFRFVFKEGLIDYYLSYFLAKVFKKTVIKGNPVR